MLPRRSGVGQSSSKLLYLVIGIVIGACIASFVTRRVTLQSLATEAGHRPSPEKAANVHEQHQQDAVMKLEKAALGPGVTYKTVFNRLQSRTDTICQFDVCLVVVSDVRDVYMQHITTNPTEKKVGQVIVDALKQVPEDKRSRYVALDVGMSQGYFTMLPAALGFETHAFEPQPACVALVLAALEQQTNVAKNVYIHNVALGSTSNVDHIKVHARTCQMLYDQSNDDARWKEENAEVTVAIQRLDSYLGDRQAAVIKVDVEGAEVIVLEGIMDAVKAKKVNHMVVEVSLNGWGAKGVTRERGLKVFETLYNAASRVVYMEHDTTLAGFAQFVSAISGVQCNMHFTFVA